jgi:hypothetical protein
MKNRKQKKLLKRFPTFFPNRVYRWKQKGKEKEKTYPFNISVGDGWFKIIWELCEKIELLLDNLPEDEYNKFQISLIKEKFGGLRFGVYYPNNSLFEEINNKIRDAEFKSHKICEQCGSKGKIRNDLGWIKVYCERHYQKELIWRCLFGRLCYGTTKYYKLKTILKRIFT